MDHLLACGINAENAGLHRWLKRAKVDGKTQQKPLACRSWDVTEQD